MKINPLDKIKIWNLKNYAETNIQRFEDIHKDGLAKQKDDINFFCKIKGVGVYFVLYTQNDSYVVRHIYVSRSRTYPTPEQVNFLLKEFGFKGKIQEDGVEEGLVVSVDEQRYAISISEIV